MNTKSRRTGELATLTALLLFIALSRALQLNKVQMHWDETWAIWQTFGTPRQILAWTPHDWSPLYFLSLGAWQTLVGIHPTGLRLLALYAYLPSTLCLHRAARRLWGPRAGCMAALAYAALNYSITLSIIVRGYAFLLALTPPTLWLTLRYFARPTWRRALPLALSMAALFYIQPTSLVVFALLGIYTLAVYRATLWQWWRPGLIASLLALPEIVNKARLAGNHIAAISDQTLPPLPETIGRLFTIYTGGAVIVWLVLLAGATGAIVYTHRRRAGGQAIAVALWVLAPVLLYFIQPFIGIFRYGEARYFWWAIPGIALWVGWGIASLPRPARMIGVGLLMAVMFLPAPPGKPRDTSFAWLAAHWQPGDVVLRDPNCDSCPQPEEWDYFGRVYFPGGLQFATDPAGCRRVWYVTHVTHEDSTLLQAVQDGRVESVFVGPPEFFTRLYEGPPDAEGRRFANGLRFHGMELLDTPSPSLLVRHEGEALRVRLWWSVDTGLHEDYSISIQVAHPGGGPVLAQTDGPPQVVAWDTPPTTVQTSHLEPGRFYIDERTLQLPNPMHTDEYALYLLVYQSWDGQRIAAPGVDDNGLLYLRALSVKSW